MATEAPEQVERSSRRLRPHQLVIALGVAVGLFTVGSGLLPLWTKWHDDSPVQREVFIDIPSAVKLAFYTIIPLLIVYGSVLFAQRVKNWERGAPDRRATTPQNAKRRLADFRAGVYMQTLLRDPAAGVMHSLIYFSFLILAAVTTVDEANHLLPESAKFLHGGIYQSYSLIAEVAGVLFLVGIIWAILR